LTGFSANQFGATGKVENQVSSIQGVALSWHEPRRWRLPDELLYRIRKFALGRV
jgi:hypothetical protein